MHNPELQGLVPFFRLLLLLVVVTVAGLTQMVPEVMAGLAVVVVQMLLAVQETHHLQVHHKAIMVVALVPHLLTITELVVAVLVG
jgi:hypothetical protein